MKIILATGIYPPDLGGPATYVRALAEELSGMGNEVTVVTYGDQWVVNSGQMDKWSVVRVGKHGGPLLRWMRYARALREHGRDADLVYAFSSVSCGVPLILSCLLHPKRVLRLGGDFFWERYTDRGGKRGLREWYESRFAGLLVRSFAGWILSSFDHIVFSSRFQEELYEKHYPQLPHHSVIENAVPTPSPSPGGGTGLHVAHAPFRLLFLGRFVGFKQVPNLLAAMEQLPECTLTLAGDGPERSHLESTLKSSHLEKRVTSVGPRSGTEKQRLFEEHDLLVLPSLTEISPNVALEARAAGLPVLLTEETGLSTELARGMLLRPLTTPEAIIAAVSDCMNSYESVARDAAGPAITRGWDRVADDHMRLFGSLTVSSAST